MSTRPLRLRASSALTATTVLVALGNLRCGSSAPEIGQVAQSSVARVTAPVVSADDTATLASDNLGFAVDLYQALRPTGGNLVFSPASISIALAMTYAGAATTTASEIATTLHFTLPPDRLHPAFDALDLALTTPPAESPPTAFALKIANATWAQRGFQFLSGYLDLLALDYGAGLRTVNFAAPEPSRMAINSWVSEQTEDLIPQLLPAGSIDRDTRLVLTDAVFFHGDWLNPFDPHSPMGVFHADSGDVSVAMMSNQSPVLVWSGTGWTAAAVPYVGDTTSMVLVVPDRGTLTQFESGLTVASLASILGGQGQADNGGVAMPRFRFSTTTSLARALAAMGMPSAFDPDRADFSGIDGARDLYISDVLHQANIQVDEKGTTAAAATAVLFRRLSIVPNALVVDHPFLFFIRHNQTGAILFAGRVIDPT